MAKAPAFQFYPKDFLADAKVQQMTDSECGLYIKLLSMCWLEGSLPDDPQALALMLRVPAARFRRAWAGVLGTCFQSGEPGRLVHKRLERERVKQDTYRRRQSDNAQMRWQSRGTATALPKRCSPVSSLRSTDQEPTPTPSVPEGAPCTYCGATAQQTGRAMEWDHFVPRTAGGGDGPENLVLACHQCNQAKQGRLFPTVDEARDWLHHAYWTSNRRRWIEHRAVAFGGVPPPDVLTARTRITPEDTRRAEEILRRRLGWCPHEPKCGNHRECVTAYARELAEKREAVAAS